MSATLFYICAAVMLLFSVLSVTSRRILRAAVFLLFVLVATAAVYFLMRYHFLGALQLTLYAGGIIILIIFSIMLTTQVNEKLEKPTDLKVVLAGISALAGSALVLMVVLSHNGFIIQQASHLFDVKQIAVTLISYQKNGYALPFEVISILLLAAMVAAIIMAKRDLKQQDK